MWTPWVCFTNTSDLSKNKLTKYTMPEITSTVRTSSRNPTCVPKACPCAHIQSFSSKPSQEVRPPHYTSIERTLRRAPPPPPPPPNANENPLVSSGAVHSLSPHQPGERYLVAFSSTKPHSPTGHGNNHECNKVCQSDKVVIDLHKWFHIIFWKAYSRVPL